MLAPTMPVTLQVPLNPQMLSVATGFAEQCAQAWGLGRAGALSLGLCAEEIFAYLGKNASGDEYVRLEASFGGYFVELNLEVSLSSLPVSVFNLTSTPGPADSVDLEQLGLLIASRSVDRFNIRLKDDRRLVLSFRKGKEYPADDETARPASRALREYQVAPAETENGKIISRLLRHHYPPYQFLPSFATPGLLADMLASGRYRAVCARDGQGNLGGCLLWRRTNQYTFEAFGPYIFGQPQGREMAQALLEACLNRIARQDATGLLLRYATPELPPDYCEPLGELSHYQADGQERKQTLFYRQLNEDQGAAAWAHPQLAPFLKREYKRLYLPRNVLEDAPAGEQRPPNSVIGVNIDRAGGSVGLHTMLDGRDFGPNLARHVEHLGKDGLPNQLFTLDLGMPYSANLAPALLETGFEPRLLVPLGGAADLLVLQRALSTEP